MMKLWTSAISFVAITAAFLTTACVGPNGPAGATGPAGTPGTAGLISLVTTDVEPAGVHCAMGGIVVRSGLDGDDNGSLESKEVTETRYVCNGDGKNSLVSVLPEAPGAHCADGGYSVSAGVDSDANGKLDPTEISSTEYVCDGVAGLNSMIIMVPESKGQNCANGGVRVQFGQDTNRNGMLDGSEFQTQYICNGMNGHNSLINQTPLPLGSAACPGGGVQIQTGIDLNDNGVLDSIEVKQTSNLCSAAACPAPRYAKDASLACPVDPDTFASGLQTNGAFLAVTDSGNVYVGSSGGGGGNDSILRITATGGVTAYWTSNYGGGSLTSLSALGENVYISSYNAGANGTGNNIVGVISPNSNSTAGVYSTVYSAARGGWFNYGVAVLDASNVYYLNYDGAGNFSIQKVTGATTSTGAYNTSGGVSAVHFDRTNKRLYFLSGKNVEYLQFPLSGSPVVQTLYTMSETATGALAQGLTTDEQGRVYAGCGIFNPVAFQTTSCTGGSIWRINADGTGAVALTDTTKVAYTLDYQMSAKTLHFEGLASGIGFTIDRLKILK